MCFKVADSEINTMKSLMGMSLNVIISDIFQVEIDEINMKHTLINDLKMDGEQESLLKLSIAEYFDNYSLENTEQYTIQKLHDDVISSNFK